MQGCCVLPWTQRRYAGLLYDYVKGLLLLPRSSGPSDLFQRGRMGRIRKSQDLSFFCVHQYWNSVWFSAGSSWFRILVGFV